MTALPCPCRRAGQSVLCLLHHPVKKLLCRSHHACAIVLASAICPRHLTRAIVLLSHRTSAGVIAPMNIVPCIVPAPSCLGLLSMFVHYLVIHLSVGRSSSFNIVRHAFDVALPHVDCCLGKKFPPQQQEVVRIIPLATTRS